MKKDVIESPVLFDTDPDKVQDEMIMKPVLASGPGGQHINKTSSAIQVYHPLSGIRFKVQDSRDQFRNRKTAVERLVMKLEKLNEKNKLKAVDAGRKKKVLKKPRKLKEMILRNKKKVSDKKKSRKLPDESE
jgi:protein subunit release factor B